MGAQIDHAHHQEPRRCFVISEYGATLEDQTHRKQVVKYVIEKALKPMGWTVVPFDTLNEPGQITNQVITRLMEYELVIADLTNNNPNVYYELAIRHASRGHVITLMSHGQKLAFDVADSRTIFYTLKDPEAIERAVADLTAQVEHVESGAEVRNIVTMATQVAFMGRSQDPRDHALGDILSSIQDIKEMLRSADDGVGVNDRVIRLLAAKPDVEYTILEIAAILQVGPGVAMRAVDELLRDHAIAKTWSKDHQTPDRYHR